MFDDKMVTDKDVLCTLVPLRELHLSALLLGHSDGLVIVLAQKQNLAFSLPQELITSREDPESTNPHLNSTSCTRVVA